MKTITALICSFFLCITSLQAQWTSHPDTLFANSPLVSVQVLDANNVWAVAYDNSEVVKTANGGQTWTALPINDPAMTGYYIMSLAVTDQSTAWITATSLLAPAKTRIYKTTDGGTTWQYQPTAYAGTSGDGHLAEINHFFDANNGVNIGVKRTLIPGTGGASRSIEVLTTTDGGTNWVTVPPANLPVQDPGEGVNTRTFSVVGNTIWFMTYWGRIYKSTDKGHTWTKSDPGFATPFALQYFSVAFADASNGLAAGNTELKRTTDGGATWTTVNPTGTWHGYEIIHVPGTAATYISAGGSIGTPGSYISNDHGATWTTLESTQQHFDLEFINPATGWSGSMGKMLKFSGSPLGFRPEITSANSFRIYPNPAKGIFQLTSASTEPFRLEVYDLVGNKVKEQEGNAFGRNTIDLNGKAKGVYLLHILAGEKRITEKLVLQ